MRNPFAHMHGVYAILCLADGTIYIGATCASFASRWSGHRLEQGSYSAGQGGNARLRAAYAAYGPKSFHYIVLERISTDDRDVVRERERFWIQWFRTHWGVDRLLNVVGVSPPVQAEPHSFRQRKHSDINGNSSKQLMYREAGGFMCERHDVSNDRVPASLPNQPEPITRYTEANWHPTTETMLSLNLSMPCCVITGDRVCGRGATAALILPNNDLTWILMPVCETCVREISRLYDAADAQSSL